MLEGTHVALRAIERADLPQLLEWRNHADYRRFFREHRELSMEQQTRWFEDVVIADPGTRMFAISRRADGRLLGAGGLCFIDPVNRSADLSIYIGADGVYIDDMLAPEVARLLIRYGFHELGLHRIWVEVYDFDAAKRRLCEALGFHLDGRHREAHFGDGRWHDSLFYGLLEGEFDGSS
jgi:RimJ/RimL family protein N-acetyltransferase